MWSLRRGVVPCWRPMASLGSPTLWTTGGQKTVGLCSSSSAASEMPKWLLPPDHLSSVRVRFAPSPTGEMHIGGVRTALYCWLVARKWNLLLEKHPEPNEAGPRWNKGSFLLRIEDTDAVRSRPEHVDDIQETLTWSGLLPDEGPPPVGGPVGPYVQSQRLPLYQARAEELVQQGHAYRCFCTQDRLETLRKLSVKRDLPTLYDRICLKLTSEQVQEKLEAGVPHVVRLKIPQEETITIPDLVKGVVTFQCNQIDDQVLLKSDGFPTYHLANVVDDHLMGISHVIRGDEWLISTVKHELLYRFLGHKPPKWAHLPLLVDQNGAKLSKRHKDMPIRNYWVEGYLPAAVCNWLAMLGWNPGTTQELFDLDQLAEAFDLTKVQKGASHPSNQKLLWFNKSHFRMMSETPEGATRLSDQLLEYLEQSYRGVPAETNPFSEVCLGKERRQLLADSMVKVFEDRFHSWNEVKQGCLDLLTTPTLDLEHLKTTVTPEHNQLLLELANQLEAASKESPFPSPKQCLEPVKRLVKVHKVTFKGMKDVLPQIRYALTGATSGIPVGEVMSVLGADTCVVRLRGAAELWQRTSGEQI